MDHYVPLPPLPERINRLNELACDLWWSWNSRAREVFRDLDYPLWRFTSHNPVLLLHLVEPERLEFAASDPDFLRIYDDAVAALDAVCSGTGTWWTARARRRDRSPGSLLNSPCTSRCRCARPPKGSSAGTSRRKRAISACRSSAWD